MGFNKFTWVDRDSDYPSRRTITDEATGTSQLVTIVRNEGTVREQGTQFNATNMNSLENRIDEMFPVSIANGGTGATTAEGVLQNLGLSVESGTWTPTFICRGSGTNPTYTISSTNSHYYRIGDLVYITFFIHANITNIGSGSAHIDGLPFAGHSNTDRQAISLSVRGPFSTNTALTVTDSQTYLKIGVTDGSDQSWSTGDIYIGGSGCYLTN